MVRRLIINFILLLCAVFIPTVSHANAHLRINEIMYNPEGSDVNHEWVEVYNDGSGAIDLASWYLWEGNTYHGLHPDGFTQLAPGEYAIIVRNLDTARAELGSSNHYVRASFSLNNTGELLRITNSAKEAVDEVSYQKDWGGNGNGKSLQYLSGSWGEGDPTPGRKNTIHSSESSSGEKDTSASEEGNSQEETSDEGEDTSNKNHQYRISIPVFTQKLIAGEQFQAKIRVFRGSDEVHDGLFLVNFGDGNLVKTREAVKKYVNRYLHPGRYVFTFEYYPSSLFYENEEKPEVSFQKIISVDERETLTIEKVNPYDGVVVKNNGISELKLEGWSLKWNGKQYVFPHATILLPHEVVRISFKTLGFSPFPTRGEKIFLVSNAGVVVSNYPTPPYPSRRSREKKRVLSKVPLSERSRSTREGREIDFNSLPHFPSKGESEPFQDYLEKHPGKVLISFPQEGNRERERETPFSMILPLAIAFSLTIISSLIALVSFSKRSIDEGKGESVDDYHVEFIDGE